MFGYVDLVVFISVLAAAAMLLPTALNWNHMAFTAQVAQVESQQLATITDAALQYEYANSATLDAPNSSHTVTIANLIAQGFLPVGTKATDTYGNPITVQFNADGSGNVTGYVVDQGQKVYSDLEAGRLMLDLGDRGGYVPAMLLAGQQPNVIYGSGGTWELGAPAGISPGSIEVKVEPNAAQEADDSRFLWRVPAPNASENTMSTPLIMAATESEGTGCSYTGAIAQDGTGALVSCQYGVWTAVGGGHWKTPVSTYSALPGSGNQIGDVRLTEDTDRAFAWNGGSWVALAVNQNGNLHVPNTLTADNNRAVINEQPGDGAELNMYDDNGNEYAHIQNAPFGAFLTLKSNAGDDISFVSQGNMMTLWDAYRAQNTWAVHSDGTWEGAPGTFCLPGQGNMGATTWEPCNNGWGWQPQYNTGWSMVTQGGPGNLNTGGESALGSINADDYYDRASGEWFSQVASQVNNQQNEINSQQGQINNLNNEYSSQQGEINGNMSAISSINTNLDNANVCSGSPYAALQTICSEIQSSGGSYVGAFGPATLTQTSYQVCGWHYTGSGQRYWGCSTVTNNGPASASGTANGGGMTVDGQGAGPGLPDKPLLISVTGLVGSENGGAHGANWGGLTTPCTNNGVGASILAYVGSTQVADISLTKTGQPDYIAWVTTENTATFVVPAGQSFSIQANSTCAQFRGVVWAL